MKDEDVAKGYDPLIMKRLFGFAKPYRGLLLIALTALLLGTAAELGIPLVLQNTVDRVFLPDYYKVSLDTVRDRMLDRDLKSPDIERVNLTEVFVSAKGLGQIGKQESGRLRSQGKISATAWYVLAWPAEKERAAGMLRDMRIEHVADERSFAVPQNAISKLPMDKQLFLRSSHFDLLIAMCFLFLGLLVASVGLSFVQIYTTALAGQGVMKDLRLKLYAKTLGQSSGFLQNNPVGRVVTRLTNDVETINELFTSVLTSLVKDIALMAGVFVALFLLDWRLALWSLASVPVLIVITLIFQTRARKAYRLVRKTVSKVNAFLAEHLSGMHIVQLFVKEKRTGERFAEGSKELYKANMSEMYVMAVFRPVVDFLAVISVALIIYVAAGQVLQGLLSLGVLVAFITLIQRFYEPVMDISEKFNLLQSAMAGGERVFDLMDTDQAVVDLGKKQLTKPIKGDIVFNEVQFSYKQGEPVLKGLSFKANAGEKIAVVGYTGAGKTTISNLLIRMWDIQGGTISVDGIDIKSIPLKDLRSAIQPIQQDVFLFGDSIRENILMGLPMSDEDLRIILGKAQALDFVDGLPKGVDTMLNEGATTISIGQRQLLSLARILAQNPRIIIMDEATSNVDTETEQRIQLAMREVLKDRTALVIAHRLSTIHDSDRILVLAEGRLIEEGKHEDLMQAEGFYSNLYKIQFAHAKQ